MWADNCKVKSHSKAHLEQMSKDLIQEAGRWDLEPKPAISWCTSTYDSEEKKDLMIDAETGSPQNAVRRKFLILGFTFPIRRKHKTAWRKGCKQGLVERCEELQKQRRAVESEVQKDDGTCLERLLLWKRNLVLESCHSGQNQGMEGDEGDEAGISIKTEDDETWANYCTRGGSQGRCGQR